MSSAEQILFVKQLTDTITDKVVTNILNGKIPESWDGVELRQILADHYAHASLDRFFTRSRRAAYYNVVSINNL